MLVREEAERTERKLMEEIKQVQSCLQSIDSRQAAECGRQGDLTAQASHVSLLSTDMELRRWHGHSLERLRRAHRRLGRGGYGLCESCGAPIHPERLRVLPGATRCVRCQRAAESS
jgi:RNA polymerase-binding transcription factor DksA